MCIRDRVGAYTALFSNGQFQGLNLISDSYNGFEDIVISEEIAMEIKDMLSEAVNTGTGRNALVKNTKIIGKTGTTNDSVSTWFSGFHKDLVTTVWVGTDDFTSLGNKEFGSTIALPIWLNYMDFRDRELYLKDVEEFKPNYLFHLGAFTNLEFCEKNKNKTYITNTLSVENAVFVANKLDIPLLYISTAGIFDGKQDKYDDWSDPNPLGVYARTKYMAEKFVQRILPFDRFRWDWWNSR